MDKGGFVHVQEVKEFDCKVDGVIMDLIMKICDEVSLLAIRFLAYR